MTVTKASGAPVEDSGGTLRFINVKNLTAVESVPPLLQDSADISRQVNDTYDVHLVRAVECYLVYQ